MRQKEKFNRRGILLTTLIVLTVTAIVIVGFVLAWDIFDISGKLSELLDTDLYGSNEPLCRSDTVVNISLPPTNGLPDAEREVLEKYFTCYYASLGSFYHENISRFYVKQCIDELFDEMTLEHEIYVSKNSPADYSFKECEMRMTVLSRRSIDKEKPNTARLTVECSTEIVYGFSEIPVRASGEKHIFELTTKGKSCLISAHTTERAARMDAEAVLDRVLAEAGYIRKDISYTYFPPYLKRTSELLERQHTDFRERIAAAFEEELTLIFSAEYDFNREAAAEYARGASSSPKYGDYDENDANFCSQCLAESGIPMDAQGDKLTQWKWYGYTENNAREHYGCTKSWFDRERFWVYANENTGFGLVAQETERGETGDIIQLTEKDKPVLQAIITGTVSDNGGNVTDYVICTDKMKNIPLSLVWTGDVRIMHIIGYNTANI